MQTVEEAARALLDAFGGDTPDWIRPQAEALECALERQGNVEPDGFVPHERIGTGVMV